MPRPNGERRPGDVIGCAVAMMKIATGEMENDKKSGELRGGHFGMAALFRNTTVAQRIAIVRKAAAGRWR